MEIQNNGESRERFVDKRLQINIDWVNTLEHRQHSGEITLEEKIQRIARGLTARDLIAQRATERAKKDGLTGLLRKDAFEQELDKMIKSGAYFGLLILDLDHFKLVNDKYGHAAGDSVISQCAMTIVNSLRQLRATEEENDIEGRVGGEEFAVIVKGIQTPLELSLVAEKVRKELAQTLSVTTPQGRYEIPVSASIGGKVWDGKQSRESLYQEVDKQGMYAAKQAGRNQSVILH